jgi:CRP-like cAMP-binding protein
MVILDKLDNMRFCEGLSRRYMQRLVSIGEYRTYQEGEILFYEGQSSTDVYLLMAGEVVLEITIPGQGPAVVQTVDAGELLGWSPILGLEVMSATARAVTPCRVLALNATRILALAEEDPRFVLEFMRRTAITLAKRLAATRVQLLEACLGTPQVVS